MVFLALLALILGMMYGLFGLNVQPIDFLAEHTDYLLYVLMFLVGISVGMHHGLLEKIKEYHVKILMIPAGIIVGSFLGGVVCSFLTKTPVNVGTAIACGLGWYSLSSVSIGNLAGAAFGSIAFLSNLMREIFSFFTIPWIARHLNYYSCIAPAGATSEDTTLPMMIRYTNEETVVMSVLNGVICSAMVPVLISFCYSVL